MANRDTSQRVGFVYKNIYEIRKKTKAAEPKPANNHRIIRAEDLIEAKIAKFEPRPLIQKAAVVQQSEPSLNAPAAMGINPFDDLKANIAKLQDLHSKLRFMLKELENLVGKK